MSANFSRFIVYASFQLNKEYIASVLCVNKAKPQLQCKGKCYLTKKIKQAEQEEKSQERDSQKNRLMDAIITKRITLKLPFHIINTPSNCEIPFLIPEHSSIIFHPPQV